MRKSLKERILDNIKIDPITNCWEWQLCCDPDGYAQVGYKDKTYKAGRLFYQLINGEIPRFNERGQRLCVLHKCDNRKCINTEHLFLGTNMENTTDMISKNRMHKNKGEKIGTHKLTEKQVLEIRAMYSTKLDSQYQIAKMYDISAGNVSCIVNRKIWTHI